MILDAQNLHTFSQSRQTPGLQPYLQVSVLDAGNFLWPRPYLNLFDRALCGPRS